MHIVSQAKWIANLIDDAKPGSNIGDVFGVGNSRIALKYLAHGRTESGVISNPANSTVSSANSNFAEFAIMPLLPRTSSHSTVCQKDFSIDVDHNNASFIHLV